MVRVTVHCMYLGKGRWKCFFDAKSPIRDVKRVGFILFYALHALSLYEYF